MGINNAGILIQFVKNKVLGFISGKDISQRDCHHEVGLNNFHLPNNIDITFILKRIKEHLRDVDEGNSRKGFIISLG